jgi:tRNA nucleotidyltransferase/poly(A) polymerase
VRLSRTVLKEKIKAEKIVQSLIGRPFKGDVYLVGGAIREISLDASPKDYDFVLSHERDLAIFESVFGGSAFTLGKKALQTHRIVVRDVSLDIMFLAGSIGPDLMRRDFAMNAIAFDIGQDKLLDPLNGIRDIEERIIRFPAKEVLSDDPLRMLKAIRHFSTLPDFTLDEGLLGAISELRGLICRAAPERIKSELDQIVTSKRAFEGIKVMEQVGLLFELVPEFEALRQMDVEKGFVLETYGHAIDGFRYIRKYSELHGLDTAMARNVGYALLFHDLGKAHTFSYDETKNAVHFFYHERFSCDIARVIMERFRFSGHELKAVLSLIENHMRIFLISSGESTDRATRRLVYKMGDLTPALIVLTMCDMFGSSGGDENLSTQKVEEKCRAILEAYREWKREPLPRLVNGNDLLSFGFKSGPAIGMILADIREKQIVGEIKGREDALRYARTFLPPSSK